VAELAWPPSNLGRSDERFRATCLECRPRSLGMARPQGTQEAGALRPTPAGDGPRGRRCLHGPRFAGSARVNRAGQAPGHAPRAGSGAVGTGLTSAADASEAPGSAAKLAWSPPTLGRRGERLVEPRSRPSRRRWAGLTTAAAASGSSSSAAELPRVPHTLGRSGECFSATCVLSPRAPGGTTRAAAGGRREAGAVRPPPTSEDPRGWRSPAGS